jgi:hypothetical protein
MEINKKESLQQCLPLSEAEMQGLLHPGQTRPVLHIFLRGFSLSTCPQHSLKVLLLESFLILNFMCRLLKVCTQP